MKQMKSYATEMYSNDQPRINCYACTLLRNVDTTVTEISRPTIDDAISQCLEDIGRFKHIKEFSDMEKGVTPV